MLLGPNVFAFCRCVEQEGDDWWADEEDGEPLITRDASGRVIVGTEDIHEFHERCSATV